MLTGWQNFTPTRQRLNYVILYNSKGDYDVINVDDDKKFSTAGVSKGVIRPRCNYYPCYRNKLSDLRVVVLEFANKHINRYKNRENPGDSKNPFGKTKPTFIIIKWEKSPLQTTDWLILINKIIIIWIIMRLKFNTVCSRTRLHSINNYSTTIYIH